MKPLEVIIAQMEDLQREFGVAQVRQAWNALARKKVHNPHREKRKRFSWALYRKLYHVQKGICPRCLQVMPLLKGRIEIDHRDPNRQDFNGASNLQLMHTRCNRSKGSTSIPKQARNWSKTYVQLLSNDPVISAISESAQLMSKDVKS